MDQRPLPGLNNKQLEGEDEQRHQRNSVMRGPGITGAEGSSIQHRMDQHDDQVVPQSSLSSEVNEQLSLIEQLQRQHQYEALGGSAQLQQGHLNLYERFLEVPTSRNVLWQQQQTNTARLQSENLALLSYLNEQQKRAASPSSAHYGGLQPNAGSVSSYLQLQHQQQQIQEALLRLQPQQSSQSSLPSQIAPQSTLSNLPVEAAGGSVLPSTNNPFVYDSGELHRRLVRALEQTVATAPENLLMSSSPSLQSYQQQLYGNAATIACSGLPYHLNPAVGESNEIKQQAAGIPLSATAKVLDTTLGQTGASFRLQPSSTTRPESDTPLVLHRRQQREQQLLNSMLQQADENGASAALSMMGLLPRDAKTVVGHRPMVQDLAHLCSTNLFAVNPRFGHLSKDNFPQKLLDTTIDNASEESKLSSRSPNQNLNDVDTLTLEEQAEKDKLIKEINWDEVIASSNGLICHHIQGHAPDSLFFALAQMVKCTLSQNDLVGKYKHHTIGAVGLCCKHCGGMPNGGGRYFPSTFDSFVNGMNPDKIVDHIIHGCQDCPPKIKQSVEELRRRESLNPMKKRYGSRKRFFYFVWAQMHNQKYIAIKAASKKSSADKRVTSSASEAEGKMQPDNMKKNLNEQKDVASMNGRPEKVPLLKKDDAGIATAAAPIDVARMPSAGNRKSSPSSSDDSPDKKNEKRRKKARYRT